MALLDAERSAGTDSSKRVNELELALSALAMGDVAGTLSVDQRARPRISYRVSAVLQRTSYDGTDSGLQSLIHVYVRDANARGIGFLCREHVAARDAMLHLPLPDGRVHHIGGWISRCREFRPGWYEAAIRFDREEPELSPDRIAAAFHQASRRRA